MLNIIEYLLAQGTSKVVLDLLLSVVLRHIHLLNADDSDATPEWRKRGPAPPTLEEAAAPQPLPNEVTGSKKDKITQFGSQTLASDRVRRGMMRTRMIAAGDWQFNEDGEFDDVLDETLPLPDQELQEQRAQLPTAAVSPLDMSPQLESLHFTAHTASALQRANALLKVSFGSTFWFVLPCHHQFAPSNHAS